jgi:hypothetical protein
MPAPQFGHLSLDAAMSGAVNSVVSSSAGDLVKSRRSSTSSVDNESTAVATVFLRPAADL